ncbi:unnamed protein product, partial [Staurois parvus]
MSCQSAPGCKQLGEASGDVTASSAQFCCDWPKHCTCPVSRCIALAN